MCVKNAEPECTETQAILKSMSRSVFGLQSEVGKLRANLKHFKRKIEEIITHCSVYAKLGSKFPRYVNEKVLDQFQAFALTVEKNLKQCAARKTAESQQISSETVREWTNCADQDF